MPYTDKEKEQKYQKEYREKHKEERRAYQKKYVKKNRDKMRIAQRRHIAGLSDEKKAELKAYYSKYKKEHREEINKRQRIYRESYPEAIKRAALKVKKGVDEMSDDYIIHLIARNHKCSASEIRKHPDISNMIIERRKRLKCRRDRKEEGLINKNESKKTYIMDAIKIRYPEHCLLNALNEAYNICKNGDGEFILRSLLIKHKVVQVVIMSRAIVKSGIISLHQGVKAKRWTSEMPPSLPMVKRLLGDAAKLIEEKNENRNKKIKEKENAMAKCTSLENQELIQAMQETISDQKSGLALMKNVLIENIGLIQKAMQDIVALQKAVKRLPTMNAGLLGHKTTLESIETKISVLEKSLPNYEWVRTFHETVKVLQDQITRLQKEQDSGPVKRDMNEYMESSGAILKRHDAEINTAMEYIETVKATMVLSGANDVSLGKDIELLRNRITILELQAHVSPDEVNGLKADMAEGKIITDTHKAWLLERGEDIKSLRKKISALVGVADDHEKRIVENQRGVSNIHKRLDGQYKIVLCNSERTRDLSERVRYAEANISKINSKPWFPFRLRSPIYKKED